MINSQMILQVTLEIRDFGRTSTFTVEHHPKVEDSWRSWEPQRERFFNSNEWNLHHQ